jgi:hypothetical protein
VDSFSAGGIGFAYGVFCHPTAGIFVTGESGSGKNGAGVWTTRRSINGGITWSTVDIYSGSYTGYKLGGDAFGNIYAVGPSAIRKGVNGGASWSTVDNFSYCITTTNSSRPYKVSTQCYSGIANSFTIDSNGNLFAVGLVGTPSGTAWLVKENAGGTGAWNSVDVFQFVSGQTADAFAATSDTSGHVYVAGYGSDGSGQQHWIVRRN